METTENKTLKERFEAMNEIPEGFRDDFNEIWATLEPELEEFNKTLAPPPPAITTKRRLTWVPAAAAAILFLLIGSISGMLWQSKQDNRILQMALELQLKDGNQPQANSTALETTTEKKNNPKAAITTTTGVADSITMRAVSQKNTDNTIAKTNITIAKKPVTNNDTAMVVKNEAQEKIASPIAQPVPQTITINEAPTAKNKMRMVHRNQPYAVASAPMQETLRSNMDLYALNSRFTVSVRKF